MTIRDDLQRWASAKSWRQERAEAGPHALSRAREFAPMTRAKAQKRLMGRDGLSRRLLMGEAAGRVMRNPRGEIVRVLPVPLWSCDPVPTGQKFHGGGGSDAPITPQSAAWVDPTPDDLRWIDQALAQLGRVNHMRMLVVREEFMGTGSQRVKARRVAEEYDGLLSYDQYKRELRRGLDWIETVAPHLTRVRA